MRQNVLSFANFVLKFGEEKALLDYAKDVVIPAFTDDKLIKNYSSTSFYFYEAKLEVLSDDAEEPTLAITGRFIKDTKLKREQIFDPEKGLVKDEAVLRSCPNAYFMLVLNDHRLIYLPETKNAPGFGVFKNTAIEFIRIKHNEYVTKLKEDPARNGEKTTKKILIQQHPKPTLEILPLISSDAMDAFVDRYETLKQIDFRLIRPNEEIDTQGLLTDVRNHLGRDLKATSTKITTSNPKGLDKSTAREKLKDAADSDNREIILSGIDQSGNQLKGDNESFKVETPLETVPNGRQALNNAMFDAFLENIKAKSFKPANVAEHAKIIIKKLRSLL